MSNIAPPFASSPAPSLFPQLTFTQGFLVGQVSVIVIVIALIRYLLLEDPATDDLTAQNQQQHHHSAKRRGRASSSSSHFPVSSSDSTSHQPLNSLLSLSLSLGGSHPNNNNSTNPPVRVKSPPPAPSSAAHGSGPSLAALAMIPDAVGYDMETAADTDVGWLNVLLAHAWAGYRDDFLAGGTHPRRTPTSLSDDDSTDDTSQSDSKQEAHAARRTAALLMQEVLNRPKIEQGKMDFLDEIQVTECLLGNSYPTLSNARVRPRDDQGRVRVEIDVEYTDLLSLALRTAVLVNYPKPRFAVLPISLGVRITRFSGTLSLSLTSHPPSEVSQDKRSRHTLELSLHPDFLLAATCSSLVGSRAKLQDIPKIQQLILQRIRSAIMDRIGWPRCFTVELPDLVRRADNRATRASAKMHKHRLNEKGPRMARAGSSSAIGSRNGLNGRRAYRKRRMAGIAEEQGDEQDDLSDLAISQDEEEGEEDVLSYDGDDPHTMADPPLDPQEALRRMRLRRRLARQRQEQASSRQDDYLYDDDDYDETDDDPQRTPRRSRPSSNKKLPSSSRRVPDGYSSGLYRSPSQYTSISRRRPNPLHTSSSNSGLDVRASATKSSRNSRRGGDLLEDDGERRPPGSLPTVEAWRKEMVKRTHGGVGNGL